MTQKPTTTREGGGVDKKLFKVELSVLSSSANHGPALPWFGWAEDEEAAKAAAFKARKDQWRGFSVCVKSATRVSA